MEIMMKERTVANEVPEIADDQRTRRRRQRRPLLDRIAQRHRGKERQSQAHRARTQAPPMIAMCRPEIDRDLEEPLSHEQSGLVGGLGDAAALAGHQRLRRSPPSRRRARHRRAHRWQAQALHEQPMRSASRRRGGILDRTGAQRPRAADTADAGEIGLAGEIELTGSAGPAGGARCASTAIASPGENAPGSCPCAHAHASADPQGASAAERDHPQRHAFPRPSRSSSEFDIALDLDRAEGAVPARVRPPTRCVR